MLSRPQNNNLATLPQEEEKQPMKPAVMRGPDLPFAVWQMDGTPLLNGAVLVSQRLLSISMRMWLLAYRHKGATSESPRCGPFLFQSEKGETSYGSAIPLARNPRFRIPSKV